MTPHSAAQRIEATRRNLPHNSAGSAEAAGTGWHPDGAVVVPLLVLGVSLLYLCFSGGLGQDWWPLHTAGALVKEGRWDAVYHPPTTTSYIDQEFRRVAENEVGNDTSPDALTAYLSTPPVAVLFVPLAGHARLSLILIRFSTVLAMFGAILLAMRAEPARAHLWATGALAMSPLMAYNVFVGQTAACFLVTATMAYLPASRGRDWFGGLALGVTILTKATPLATAVAFVLLGRRRLGLIAISSAAAVCALTWPWSGFAPWRDFYGVAQQLTHLIAVDWNSQSLDALVLRFSRHLDGGTRLIATSGETALITALRVTLLAAVAWSFWRTRSTLAVWLAWLAVTPMLWAYYLLALFPFVVNSTRQRTVPLGLLLSGSVVMARLFVPEFWAGAFGSVAWIVVSGLMLWRADQE